MMPFEKEKEKEVGGDLFRKSIYMPDVALLPSVPNLAERIRNAKGNLRGHEGFMIVSWLVDDEEEMMKMLATYEIDAVITNKPLKLLSYLVNIYRSSCI
jgi:hypothetical protein